MEIIHQQETMLLLTEIRGGVHLGNITKTMESSTGSSGSKTAWISTLLSTFFRSMAIIVCYALLLGSASAAPTVTSVSASDPKPQLLRPEKVAARNAPDSRSNSLSQLMAETNSNEGPRVKVFVYHHPALDFSDLIHCFREKYGDSPWQAERADMAQDMGEIWLHRAMLEHPWRVLEAEQADLFFIPIYPVLSYKLLGANDHQCRGLTHEQRMKNAVNYLQTRSVYFRRFGGSDHLIVCAWWNCRNVFNAWQRMVLRRVVLGINEAIKNWANWGCGGRSLTIPYTANSIITTPEYFGGAPFNKRDILFFFVGSTRKRLERKNLKVAEELYPESIIYFGEGNKWGVNATQYASYIIRSKFCFCPRGDSQTSRRIFDAVAAGCIPVLTTQEVAAMPFFHAGLNYSEFAIVAPKGGFSSEERVTAVVESIASRMSALCNKNTSKGTCAKKACFVSPLFANERSRSDEKQEALQRRVQKAAVSSLVYGLSDGPDVKDMHPILGVASKFLSEAMAGGGGDNLWTCEPTNLNEHVLAPRTKVDLPPKENSRRQWLFESETIINTEHSLLFCAPPNVGSLQFRMLAKRMKGVEHWAISNDRELLFDSTASGLSLLDLKNDRLMNSIYRHNDGGWIKIGVVRDPITRLVSSYLDYVHALASTRSPSDGAHRGLRAQDLEWFEGISGRRRLRMHDTADYDPRKNGKNDIFSEMSDGQYVNGSRKLSPKEGSTALHFERTDGDGGALKMEIVGPILPTFPDLVEALENSMNSAPPAFQPICNMCGMRYSPFDSVIPFETLEKTSTKVLKSLPGGLWGEYGASGWGPDGKYAFMEFDYGSVLRQNKSPTGDDVGVVAGAAGGANDGVEGSSSPLRARELFEANSCDWVKFYPDEAMLKRVAALFSIDYDILGWYSLDPWIERLHECLSGNS